MRMRRWFGALTMMFLCWLLLAGCKKSVGPPEDNAAVREEEGDDEEEIHMIGFSGIDMENPYFITFEHAVRELLEAEGYELITKDPGTDQEKQNTQLTEMIEEGIEAVILSPVNWEEVTPALKKLKESGVKIINVDTQVKEMDYVDAYIGSDNHSAGVLCGEDLLKRCPEGGKIAILECPTQNSINDRITGFEEVLATAEKGFEVVAREDTGGEFARALEASERILAENPDLAAIMCGNDQLAVGAKTAVNVAKLKDVLIYGVDGSPDIKKELKKHDTQIAGTAAQSPINMGKSSARLAINILTGNSYEKETYEEVFMINKDNVDMYGIDGWQ